MVSSVWRVTKPPKSPMATLPPPAIFLYVAHNYRNSNKLMNFTAAEHQKTLNLLITFKMNFFFLLLVCRSNHF